MTKTFIVAALLSTFAVASFAQASAPAAAASAPAKHKMHKMHKMHKGAAASSPEASADKKGGQ